MQKELVEHTDLELATVEELIDFIIVGNEAITAYKAKLRACEAPGAFQLKNIALRDGRKISRMVIDAEDKLGELLKNMEDFHSSGRGTMKRKELPVGINKKESHIAQEIHRNPDIVEQVWTEIKNDIPTRHHVIKKIKEVKREKKKQQQKEEIIKGIEKPDGLYDIIVIDPPWHFDGKYDADGRRTTAAYPQMSYEKIQNIELPAKEDCILWLWTTHKDIWMAKTILDNWGFQYKGLMIWDKEKMGIGTWLRFQCEFCLLGIKGKPLWENKGLRDIIREPRTGHSNKPDSFYKMIEDNFVGKKIDYFYGKKRKGWDCYGTGQNSIPK